MPTYQYACTACGEQLEAVQSFTDAALTECPACGGALRKVFSAVGVVFKGSGFYKTDSRKPAADKGATKTESTKADSAAKTDSAPKADTKTGDGKATTTTSTSTTPAAKSA
ncbi:MAG: hypothetical protein QOJ79_2164 [Actinomycetota bacterium]|nr:hypothetical protein [Actinomycetota bacterium]